MAHTVVATGLGFPEGPVWLGPKRVAFTQISGQKLSLWQGGAVSTIATLPGGPNGATLGPDGALYVANNGGLSMSHDGYWKAPNPIDGCIQRVSLDGKLSVVAANLPGARPHRPNDLCFGPDGLLYFTDPHDWENLPNLGPGRVCRTSLDGRVEKLCDFESFPNGIAFGPDDRLYVAQSMTQTILVMDAKTGSKPVPYAKLPDAFPDGFCFAADGRLYAAGSLGDVVVVFEAGGGTVREVIPFGAKSEPTNCCLGDGVLYVTLSGPGELATVPVDAEALPLHPSPTP